MTAAVPPALGTAAVAVLGAAVAVLAYRLIRLALADADLYLLSLGRHKPDAFRDKVVWITGASQVSCCCRVAVP